MCKLIFKNYYGSFSDTEEPFFVENLYFKPVYTKRGFEVETNMPTCPGRFVDESFKISSWRRYKKILKMWMR